MGIVRILYTINKNMCNRTTSHRGINTMTALKMMCRERREQKERIKKQRLAASLHLTNQRPYALPSARLQTKPHVKHVFWQAINAVAAVFVCLRSCRTSPMSLVGVQRFSGSYFFFIFFRFLLGAQTVDSSLVAESTAVINAHVKWL